MHIYLNLYSLWLRQDDRILLYPNKYTSSIANHLVVVPTLWSCSAIRVAHGRGIYERAQMFGVPFQRAVEIAIKQGFVKAEFYLPEHINNSCQSKYCQESEKIFYPVLLFIRYICKKIRYEFIEHKRSGHISQMRVERRKTIRITPNHSWSKI